jgi:hypothetical protein
VAFDIANMERETEDDDSNVKVHEIKFDEYGIMDDGLDETTEEQLKKLQGTESGKLLSVDS